MERSRVTVEYRHLHQQIFEHEAEGVHCVVQNISGGVPESLTLAQALDAVDTRLSDWHGPMEGFTQPVTDYADGYRLVVPQVIEWDLWPRLYVCDRCSIVYRTDDSTELRRYCVVPACRGTHRQLPYFRVHRCGKRQQLYVPRCRVDSDHPMRFHDAGSFITAYFSCSVCNSRYDIFSGRCDCSLTGLSTQERQYRLVKARDSKAFYPHHVTVVNISAVLSRARSANRGPLWAMAHYLGTVKDLTGLVDEATGRQSGAEADDAMQRMLSFLDTTPGLTDEQREEFTDVLNATRGEEPGLSEAESLLDAETIQEARRDRRIFERGFIFHERDPESLGEISQRYRDAGHHGMAARMDTGNQSALNLGFSRIAVIRKLPIALIAFGFTREFSDHRAQLKPLQPPERDRAARRPLVTIESNTEAVFFELDARLLWRWCHANGWTTDPDPVNDRDARAWVARHTFVAERSDVSLAIQRLTHAWAHTLIHSLEGRSAFGPNSVAEYLMERTGSFFIYVANYSTFNLGGLTTLVEQRLADWLSAAVEQTTCVHDPVCLNERGGCHKCLALAFHCERFNRGLHRGYLIGSEDPQVDVGWIFHAASAHR